MTFNEYQQKTKERAIYPLVGEKYVYPLIGIMGETGEIAEKIKKSLRDKDGIIDEQLKQDLKKELGDVLWYLSQLATELDLELNDIVKANLEKIESRHKRNVMHGEGDDR